MSRAFLLGAWLLSCVQAFGADSPPKYALLVGVCKYQHADMNRPLLKFPEKDAKDLAKIFRESGYTVELLLGNDATQTAIRNKLAPLESTSNSDGVVVLGFFGHGIEFKSTKLACYCPYDTKMENVVDSNGRQVSGDNGEPLVEPKLDSLITMEELLGVLRTSPAGNRILLADCCRNEPSQARGRAFGSNLRVKDLPPNTAALFACSAEEKAFENEQWENGAFTKCLKEEIHRLAASGRITAGKLADEMQPKVLDLVKEVTNGKEKQTLNPLVSGVVDFQLSGRQHPFEGSKAGDRKQLVAGMFFRWCPPGPFTIGSPKSDTGRSDDEDQVSGLLTQGYWIGETEVTQGQWQKLMDTAPWKGKNDVQEGKDIACSYVNWDDVALFSETLTKQQQQLDKLPSDWKYRLPTEAQWEYACRSGSAGRYFFGDDVTKLNHFAWFDRNTDATGEAYPHAVRLKKANLWGLYDTYGNVSEWCLDTYGPRLQGGEDPVRLPVATSATTERIMRGGGWYTSEDSCRSSFRFRAPQNARRSSVGFRLVCTMKQAP